MQDDGSLDQGVKVERATSRYALGVEPLGFAGGLGKSDRKIRHRGLYSELLGQFPFAEMGTSEGLCFEADYSRKKKEFSFMKLGCSVLLGRASLPQGYLGVSQPYSSLLLL